jgi:hypothetical protein
MRAQLLWVYLVAGIGRWLPSVALEMSRTYRQYTCVARAFPHLRAHELIEATAQLEEFRLRPGERMRPELDRWYIVTRGTGSLVRRGPGGHDILLRVLAPGQVWRGVGTLCADSSLEGLAVPADAA